MQVPDLRTLSRAGELECGLADDTSVDTNVENTSVDSSVHDTSVDDTSVDTSVHDTSVDTSADDTSYQNFPQFSALVEREMFCPGCISTL